MAPLPTSDALRVTVVGSSVQTIEGLGRYLNAAGLESRVTRSLADSTHPDRKAHAVVIFPDEFPTEEVLATIEALQLQDPMRRLLLVTSTPQHFQGPRWAATLQPPILLPKPAFGWSILDAIRAATAKGEDLP